MIPHIIIDFFSQFEALFKKGDLQDVTVVRAAKIQQVMTSKFTLNNKTRSTVDRWSALQVDKSELLVGDLVILKTGDKVRSTLSLKRNRLL